MASFYEKLKLVLGKRLCGFLMLNSLSNTRMVQFNINLSIVQVTSTARTTNVHPFGIIKLKSVPEYDLNIETTTIAFLWKGQSLNRNEPAQ